MREKPIAWDWYRKKKGVNHLNKTDQLGKVSRFCGRPLPTKYLYSISIFCIIIQFMSPSTGFREDCSAPTFLGWQTTGSFDWMSNEYQFSCLGQLAICTLWKLVNFPNSFENRWEPGLWSAENQARLSIVDQTVAQMHLLCISINLNTAGGGWFRRWGFLDEQDWTVDLFPPPTGTFAQIGMLIQLMGQGNGVIRNHFKCSAILRHFEIRRRWKRMLKGLVPVMSHPKSRLFLACALSAGEISSTVFEFNCVEIRNCRLILWDCSIWFILSHILVSLIRAIYPPVDKIWFWALLPKLLNSMGNYPS